MASAYLVKPLAIEQVPQAFALISLLDVALTMERWREYVKALTGAPGTPYGHHILSVQSGQGHIYGVSACHLKPDLRRDRILEIENFAVMDVTGTRRAARALLDGLEDLARRNDCHCIVVGLLNPDQRKRLRDLDAARLDLFRTAGFQGDHLRLRKCFANGTGA